MNKIFQYVGTQELLDSLKDITPGFLIEKSDDILAWIKFENQIPEYDLYWATYTIGEKGDMRLGDRRTEHVACSGRKPVLGAGEIAFEIDETTIEVIEISNLSTGFCPQASCWSAVRQALENLNVLTPDEFTHSFQFRRCTACGQRNTIKDNQFFCSNCDAALPAHWNFAD